METVYIKTKNGNILECYVSEEMNKPIYYPIENKTNGYVDYYDVERFLGIDGMYREVKQLEQELSNIKKENEVLRKNAEHNDKVVDKVNWENMFLKDKLKKIEEYINNKSEINFECGKWVNTLEIEKIIKGDEDK